MEQDYFSLANQTSIFKNQESSNLARWDFHQLSGENKFWTRG